MGQIRSVSRHRQSLTTRPSTSSSSKEADTSFTFLFDVFTFGVILFSSTDGFHHPRTRICCSDARARLELLPSAVRNLLGSSSVAWNTLGMQISEWMIQLVNDPTTPELVASTMKQSFTSFKVGEKYSEASVWSRLVPIH